MTLAIVSPVTRLVDRSMLNTLYGTPLCETLAVAIVTKTHNGVCL